jgi:hypothetical protein
LPTNSPLPIIQIATKDRSSAIRGVLCLEFIHNNKVIARSEKLLILSKPPISAKGIPFARSEGIERIPIMPTREPKPWSLHILGAYRFKSMKRDREDSISENSESVVFSLKHELSEALLKIQAKEKECEGLKKALRLLTQESQINYPTS